MKLGLLKSKEAMLPFIVPAIIEVLLISIALITILNARRADERSLQYTAAIGKVDAILGRITDSSITLFTILDVELPDELPKIQESLKQSEADLRQIPDSAGADGQSFNSLKQLVADFSEIVETVNGVAKDGASVDRMILMGNVDGVLKKAVPAVKQLRNDLVEKQREVAVESEGKLNYLTWILSTALMLPVVVAAYAFVFSSRLSSRMAHLSDSVVKISLGEPLEEKLEGKDELAELERSIRELAVVMERSRHKERAMIDNAAEIICSLDESLRLSELNPAIGNLGYEHSEVMGTNIQSLIHPDDREETYRHLEAVKNSASASSFEARLKHYDGGFVHTQWSINWSPDDRSILCVIHDISDRKKAEQLKQDVIAMVSHDLRAPLTSIGVVLDMVLEGAAGELNDRGARLVKRAQHSVTALIAMIKDLLDIERFEAGGLSLALENVNSRDLIQRSVDMVKPEADKRKLNIEIPSIHDDHSILCDGERLNRVLVNLINNAIKFSKSGKSIYVTCKLLKYRSGTPDIEFQVIDEGPGIPPHKLDSIFNKFTQVGTGSEGERMGSGLGLAICKAIVEAHGGKIGVSSAPGEGATFWFRIPQAAEEGKSAQSSSSAPSEKQPASSTES